MDIGRHVGTLDHQIAAAFSRPSQPLKENRSSDIIIRERLRVPRRSMREALGLQSLRLRLCCELEVLFSHLMQNNREDYAISLRAFVHCDYRY